MGGSGGGGGGPLPATAKRADPCLSPPLAHVLFSSRPPPSPPVSPSAHHVAHVCARVCARACACVRVRARACVRASVACVRAFVHSDLGSTPSMAASCRCRFRCSPSPPLSLSLYRHPRPRFLLPRSTSCPFSLSLSLSPASPSLSLSFTLPLTLTLPPVHPLPPLCTHAPTSDVHDVPSPRCYLRCCPRRRPSGSSHGVRVVQAAARAVRTSIGPRASAAGRPSCQANLSVRAAPESRPRFGRDSAEISVPGIEPGPPRIAVLTVRTACLFAAPRSGRWRRGHGGAVRGASDSDV